MGFHLGTVCCQPRYLRPYSAGGLAAQWTILPLWSFLSSLYLSKLRDGTSALVLADLQFDLFVLKVRALGRRGFYTGFGDQHDVGLPEPTKRVARG